MTTNTNDGLQQPKPELLLANWHEELDGVDLYRFLASRETDDKKASLLLELAAAEARHARVMENGLKELNIALPVHRVSFQTRFLKTLARLFGPGLVYPLLHEAEIVGSAEYASQSEITAPLAGEERQHARTLGQLSGGSHPISPSGHTEHWHRSGGGGTLRATVFGISDGLVSNLSLVMGFAGASADAKFVLLAGLSGLLAGASSMAAGEYVSMKAQRELYERQIELEAAELSVTPKEEEEELALIYRAKGLPKAEAERLASRLAENPDVALDSLVREELGLDPQELGSPTGAAISSFVAFAAGALLPVLPYFFGGSALHVGLSLLLAALALFGVGAVLSVFTGRGVLFSGARQLVIGAVAATITFGLGKLIGVSTGV
jgi:VIT1/CCC1 family predicted Fe2+/Mn2+ transporter